MKLLHIDSSILAENSVSRALSKSMVDKLTASHPDWDVTYIDLAKNPIGHLSGELFAAQAAKPEDRTPEQQKDVDVSEKTMADFLAADVIVIGAPMYNFTISTQLKAWLDRIAVAGKTFRYTANGPEGLVSGKRVIIASSRGGFYGEGSAQFVLDHQEQYLKTIFAFMGINNLEFVRAEGVSTGPENKAKAMESANKAIALAAA